MFVIRRKRRALGALIIAAGFLLAAGCSLEEDAPEEEFPEVRGSLDPRLYGLWRFAHNGAVMEEIEITGEAKGEGNLGSLTYRGIYHSADLGEIFAGDIVYAENFSDQAGIIIIEYWPDHKQVWIDWDASFYPFEMVPRKPQPPGNFYGIYFLRLNEAATEALLACTSDQNNNYGPTEAASLEEAVARFTEENRDQWLNISVGDIQQKIENTEKRGP
jgi:hypothetical protein